MLHIANAYFEEELREKGSFSLQAWLFRHPIYLQLQYLPFLYASSSDHVLVSHLPEKEYRSRLEMLGFSPPSLCLLEDKIFPASTLDSWGASESIALWTKKNGISYDIPTYDVVKEVNSKEFSYQMAPKLQGSALFTNVEKALSWCQSNPFPKVFKTIYGVSGKGHLLITPSTPQSKILSFLHHEFKQDHAVIAEPWVERTLDFSTQWILKKEGKVVYLGSTICENTLSGSYRKTIVANEDVLFQDKLHFVHDHKRIVQPILESMVSKGYFGNVGIDAMIYHDENNPKKLLLHPVVEINARKTMGFVALHIRKTYFPHQSIEMSFTSDGAQDNLLPHFVIDANQKKTLFAKKLVMRILHSS